MATRRAASLLRLWSLSSGGPGADRGDCYCYLPLYVFCGRHLLATRLRRANIAWPPERGWGPVPQPGGQAAGAVEEVARIVSQIRTRWPRVSILLRADSGFARDELMAWCEANAVDYVFGLGRNARPVGAIAEDLAAAQAESRAQGGPRAASPTSPGAPWTAGARRAGSHGSGCAGPRTGLAKAEHLPKGANPRFVVTSLPARALDPRTLDEDVYCARGAVENSMYGRLPRCKQVSSSLRHAPSLATARHRHPR